MRRAMGYLRWELYDWLTQRHGRERSTSIETKTVANFMRQFWKRGAIFVLVIALSPILFPLGLLLSFVGLISSVPLLCGAATYYLLLRRFYLPLSITERFGSSKCAAEGLSTGLEPGGVRMPLSDHVIQVVKNEQEEPLLKTFVIGEGTQDQGRESDAKTTVRLECDPVVNERDADNCEFQNTVTLKVPLEVNCRISGFSAGTSSSVMCHSDLESQSPPTASQFSEEGKNDGNGEVLDCKPFEEQGKDARQESTSGLFPYASDEFTEESMKLTSGPFSCSALLTTLENTSCGDSESITRYWRDEVDTVLSSKFARVAQRIGNRGSESSTDVACLKSFTCVPEKTMMNDLDNICLLDWYEAEIFSASQMPNLVQYKEKLVAEENGRTGPSHIIASSPCTHQRRLSFSSILADDKRMSPGFLPLREKIDEFSSDCKRWSVSTSLSLDYVWPSESSEHGLELLPTRGTSCEEPCIDTASSTVRYGEEIVPEHGVVLDASSTYPSISPTSDQLTEDWKTRRERWEEESTPGRLPPYAPYMEAPSIQARSMCNPLFEFSTPSPPLRKLNTGGKTHTSNSSSFHACYSGRNSAPLEILRTQTWLADSTPSPPQHRRRKCKSSMYTERLDDEVIGETSVTRRHARSHSASFTESMEPDSGEFEGLLGLWRRRDKTSQSLTSSPRGSSPAEVAHLIREELNSIQMIIGQKVPPQYSMWKEVETLSQMIGMKLPYMGDISDLNKARQGLDLLKVVIGIQRGVGL